MITLSIRYQIDPGKLRDFEAYSKSIAEPIRRSGGDLIGYFLPTRFAGRTNEALALINFADLAAYQRYREVLGNDPDNVAAIAQVESTGCIQCEDRSFLQKVP